MSGALSLYYSMRSKEIAKLDKAFSRWLRKSHSDKDGYVQCWTCGTKKRWQQMQAGHFQSRSKYSTRWTYLNVMPQCPRCNLTNGGQQYIFGKRLDEVHGAGTADELVRLSNQTTKYSTAEIQEMARKYRKAFDELP